MDDNDKNAAQEKSLVTPIPRVALKPDEAAQALGISTRKLWELSNTKDIPSFKVGSRRMYCVQRLNDWAVKKSDDNAG